MYRDAGDGFPLLLYGVDNETNEVREFNQTPFVKQYYKYRKLMSTMLKGREIQIGDFVRHKTKKYRVYRIDEFSYEVNSNNESKGIGHVFQLTAICKEFIEAAQMPRRFRIEPPQDCHAYDFVHICDGHNATFAVCEIKDVIELAFGPNHHRELPTCRYSFIPESKQFVSYIHPSILFTPKQATEGMSMIECYSKIITQLLE